ncbi:uncharacterized protein [Aegilops tauschii subsp. strangulata]|uniref:uncharacterized protein n=1 Tax=Aegilops tauschii subsp. strangulata TaxID=200361 RepID=UPI00098B78FE
MSDDEKKKKAVAKAAAGQSPSSGAPVARLTAGGSGELRVIERIVRDTEASSASMMLTRTNYMEWALVMQVKLQVARVWSALTEDAADECDGQRALQIILTGVPPEMLRVLAAKDTAKMAWETIKMMRMGSERAREAKAHVRRREFEDLRFRDGESVEDFGLRLSSLVADMELYGDPVTEHKAVQKFLRVVPRRYRPMAMAIESLIDLKTMSIEELVGSFSACEDHYDLDDGAQPTGRLLLTHEEWLARQQGKKEQANLVREGGDEHEQGLFMAMVTPGTAAGPVAPQAVFLNEEKVIPVPSPDGLWYFDTGATSHMTGEKSMFAKLDEGVHGTVKFGDGSHVAIRARGSIVFKCQSGEQRALTEVYYIPSLRSNIISVGQLDEGGCQIGIQNGLMTVHDPAQRILARVRRSSTRLYTGMLTIDTPVCLMMKVDDETWKWHARMGHLHFRALHAMSAKGMVRGMPEIARIEQYCDGCALGKQHRAPFPQAKFKLFVDNQAAIALSKNPVHHDRSKHIDIKYHYIRDCVEKGQVKVDHIPTRKQIADALTKALGRNNFVEMRQKLGMIKIDSGR